MTKHYVTFGQVHTHRIGRKTFDADCVARFDAPDAATGRLIAEDLFSSVFCFDYHGEQWEKDETRNMSYFPRGYVDVPLAPGYSPPRDYRRHS